MSGALGAGKSACFFSPIVLIWVENWDWGRVKNEVNFSSNQNMQSNSQIKLRPSMLSQE